VSIFSNEGDLDAANVTGNFTQIVSLSYIGILDLGLGQRGASRPPTTSPAWSRDRAGRSLGELHHLAGDLRFGVKAMVR
jgi:hypothetical protein